MLVRGNRPHSLSAMTVSDLKAVGLGPITEMESVSINRTAARRVAVQGAT